jgi:hypothetical protein
MARLTKLTGIIAIILLFSCCSKSDDLQISGCTLAALTESFNGAYVRAHFYTFDKQGRVSRSNLTPSHPRFTKHIPIQRIKSLLAVQPLVMELLSTNWMRTVGLSGTGQLLLAIMPRDTWHKLYQLTARKLLP